MSLIYEVSLFEFLLVTVILGGGAAWLTGRAIAITWGKHWHLAVYIVLLNCAVRFIHYALFSGSLITPWYFVVDLVVLYAIALLGKRYYLAKLMTSQYAFNFARTGPFSWRERPRA